jgi:L-alanine-DL-glutamate epimerase-like enolase superfamily enzyme
MKIAAIYPFRKNLALTRPYTIATKTISAVESVFLTIRLTNGVVGVGAANPAKEVVGEDCAETLQNLESDAIQDFIGRDITEIFALLAETRKAFPHKPGTLAAMDIALHDAFCQSLEIPIAQFYGQKMKKMPTSVTIGIKNVADTLAEAQEYRDRKFKILKVKTGLDIAEDIERLHKLREQFGRHFKIRVDANQGYDAEQTRHFFKQIQKLNIECVEQPMPVGSEKMMQKLPLSIRRKMVADESLHDATAAFDYAAKKTFGIFNIKLMKCGGIAAALDIATIAQYARVDLFWGCNDESIIGITAALHAAFACPHTRYLDLDGSLDLAEDIVESGFILKNGLLSLSKGAGLGLTK